MELLIDVCSGADEVASAFVQTVWESIIDRLRAEELTATASDSVGKLEEPESELGYDDASWEERKGDDAEAQRKQKHNMSRQKLCGAAVRVGTGVVGTDIALGASTDTQLRTAGTFFGAIRISVRGNISSNLSRGDFSVPFTRSQSLSCVCILRFSIFLDYSFATLVLLFSSLYSRGKHYSYIDGTFQYGPWH